MNTGSPIVCPACICNCSSTPPHHHSPSIIREYKLPFTIPVFVISLILYVLAASSFKRKKIRGQVFLVCSWTITWFTSNCLNILGVRDLEALSVTYHVVVNLSGLVFYIWETIIQYRRKGTVPHSLRFEISLWVIILVFSIIQVIVRVKLPNKPYYKYGVDQWYTFAVGSVFLFENFWMHRNSSGR